MPNKQRMKLLPFLCVLLLSIFPCKTSASDLDIFDLISEDVMPNVLLIIDISGSMGYNDVWNASENKNNTRLAVAKKVVTEVVNDNPNVKWGLFTFPDTGSVAQSGKMIAPCMYRDSTLLASFIKTINNLSATGGTPVSSALAEAGLYFAGTSSFFWSSNYKSSDTFWDSTSTPKKYISPIENACQYNYIILLTDGFSSIDSGVKGGYNSTGTDKYNMLSKNSIFWATYLNGEKISDSTNGDYITRKGLGSKLSGFVKTADLTSLSASTTNYSSMTWSKIESGSPTLGDGDTGLRVNGQLTSSTFTTLKKNKTLYESGYNKNDPSRPFPGLPSNGNPTLYLAYQGYLQGTQIYQNNFSGDGVYGSDYLDDVAAFLNNEDLRTDLGSSGKYEKQTVKTYTVGFKFSTDLLERTAIMGGTGGEGKGYFTADDYDELKSAFSNIIKGIKEEMSSFASPSIPSSTSNEVYSGDHVYMSFFKPQDGFWLGNVKRYELDADHTLGSYMENGSIKSNSTSDWSSEEDGNDISKGGVVESLNKTLADMAKVSNTASLRKIYTYIESNNQAQLAHTDNLFIESNTKLTENNGALLGLNTSQSAVQAAITSIRLTPMGAVIHSSPSIVRYSGKTVVFVGANDGFLHAFFDNDTAAPEAWAFVMPEHLATITKARTSTPNDDVYYVDGYIAINDVDSQKVLITGARRGGSTYAALDITSYSDPKFLFQIPSLKTSEASLWSDISMGQSWGNPKFIETHNNAYGTSDAPTFTSDGIIKNRTFILVPGGYDTRYDTLTATQITSPLGGVVVGVNAITGKPDDKFELLNSQKSNIMKHAVLDLLPLDMNNDGLVDTIYYGDLGGSMFYAWPFAQSISGLGYTYNAQAKFVPYLLFKTENGESSGRKFMYAPAVVKKNGIEYVYFGSGDRERPVNTDVQDRFYCVHNKDNTRLAATSSAANYLTEADLEKVDDNLIQSTDAGVRAKAQADLDAASGWYFNLLKGEKIVGSPVIYNNYVAFTTYQPKDEKVQNPLDVCQTGSTGNARLYIVNYLTGGAVSDRNGDNKIDADDRGIIIGSSIPSAAILAHYADGNLFHVAVDGSLYSEDVPPEESSSSGGPDVFYWREIY